MAVKKENLIDRIRIFSLSFLFSFTSFAALKIDSPTPDFTLTSIEGKQVKLSDYKGKIVVLEWFNPGCPFSRKHYKSGNMQSLQSEYTNKGVVWLTINSTYPKHPNFISSEKAVAFVKEEEVKCTAMLMDPDGKVGKIYGAKTTPHMFVIDQQGNLVYQGAIDDTPSPWVNPKTARNYVRMALDEILAGKPVSTPETKPYGCSIKYED